MPQKPRVRWHAAANAWRSDVGPHGEPGGAGRSRRTPVYFREIPNTPKGRVAAERRLEEYLRARDRREAESTEEAGNPRVWPEVIRPYLEWIEAQVESGAMEPRTLRSHRERLTRWLEFAPDGG